jgi:DNA polymerase III epsilon subunit-like protein
MQELQLKNEINLNILSIHTIPTKYMLLLFFDTETTGLPPKYENKVNERSVLVWPYILQFSYIVFDTETNNVLKTFDSIIKIPPNIKISTESTNIHGITRLLSDQNGVPIIPVITEFMKDVNDVDLLIGHNIQFDLNMVYAELLRHKDDIGGLQPLLANKRTYCTMKETTQFCCLESPYYGKNYNKLKPPKLVELYEKLFNEAPTLTLHNSLNDVIVTMRCYMKFKYDRDIHHLV